MSQHLPGLRGVLSSDVQESQKPLAALDVLLVRLLLGGSQRLLLRCLEYQLVRLLLRYSRV